MGEDPLYYEKRIMSNKKLLRRLVYISINGTDPVGNYKKPFDEVYKLLQNMYFGSPSYDKLTEKEFKSINDISNIDIIIDKCFLIHRSLSKWGRFLETSGSFIEYYLIAANNGDLVYTTFSLTYYNIDMCPGDFDPDEGELDCECKSLSYTNIDYEFINKLLMNDPGLFNKFISIFPDEFYKCIT